MDARNTHSARLATAVGIRLDWWNKGEWTDTLVVGMLAADRPVT